MAKNWYIETLEALKIRAKKNKVHNMLTVASIRTDDEKLRSMINELFNDLNKIRYNTEINSLVEIGQLNIKDLQFYCEDKGYPQQVAK